MTKLIFCGDFMTWDLTIWQKSKKDASTDSGLGASAQTLVLRRKSQFFSTLERQQMFFEMHQDLENVFATKERPGLQNARVRINVPPTHNLQNAILAFFGNICGSLLNKSVSKRQFNFHIFHPKFLKN